MPDAAPQPVVEKLPRRRSGYVRPSPVQDSIVELLAAIGPASPAVIAARQRVPQTAVKSTLRSMLANGRVHRIRQGVYAVSA